MREIVGDILIDIADIIMTVNVCKKSWGGGSSSGFS